MAGANTYLNFPGTCHEAFEFYRGVFGGEFITLMRMGDAPPMPGMPPLSEEQKKRVMHVSLAISGGSVLMGSDVPADSKVVVGTNVYISLTLDDKEEADRVYQGLIADGGRTEMALADQFWGDYWGAFADKFGTQWMVTVPGKK